jgi:hypothetical protein
MREAEFTGCDLAGFLFDECDLFLAAFGPGWYVASEPFAGGYVRRCGGRSRPASMNSAYSSKPGCTPI